jgi:hypothetical protein
MQRQTKVYSNSPVRLSDYGMEQKARVSAWERADSERAQKRREMDARINVNASKWRYICSGE